MVLPPTHFKSVGYVDFSVIPIQLKVLILRHSLVRRHGRIDSFTLLSKMSIFISQSVSNCSWDVLSISHALLPLVSAIRGGDFLEDMLVG